MSSNGGRQVEKFWHQCVLVGILVLGACARFYSIDQISLSSDELRNLAFCDIKGWLAMVTEYHSYGGMPPVYPSLLCQLTDWTSTTEIFVRLLSVLAGLVTVYLIYMTGRDFLSPTLGLLAAAAMATEFRVILLNREATLYSLLALWLFAHNYYFCQLFFRRNLGVSRSIAINFPGAQYRFQPQIQINWTPEFPGEGRYLIGFWITGILAFYTSPASLIQLASELFISVLLVKTGRDFLNWHALRSLWLPLFVAILPWLPIFYEYIPWIAQGNLLGFQSIAPVWREILYMMPLNPIFGWLLFTLISIFFLFILTTRLFRKTSLLPADFTGFILFQSVIALGSLCFILTASHLSYFYFWWVFILLLFIPITICIDIIPREFLKNSTIGIVVFSIVLLQIQSNARNKLYLMGGNADFRLVAQIIHDDRDFMKTNRNIVTSSSLFTHYLDTSEIIHNNIATLDRNNSTEIPTTVTSTEFYFLEYQPADRDMQTETPIFQKLSSQHKTLCMTKMPWLRIVKFSKDPASLGNGAPDCRAYLTSTVSMQ